MSDQNPYQPAPEIEDTPDSSEPAWIYRRVAAVSSGIGTVLIGFAVLLLVVILGDPESDLVGNIGGVTWLTAMGLSLIIAGYYWYGREVNRAMGWWVFSFCLFAIAVVLG